MTQPVIPYETPHDRRALTARDLFGVIVRTFGLAIVLWGLCAPTYPVNVESVPVGRFLITEAFWLGGGLLLLRGEWLVRFSYGDRVSG